MATFAVMLDAFADKVEEQLASVIKKVALELYTRIVIKTPVDTGRARGNWMVAIARKPTGQIDRIDKQSLGSDPGSEAIASALSALSSYGPKAALSEQEIFIVNNLDYIGVLEHGRVVSDGKTRGSIQAPHGMVAVTVTEFQKIVNKAAKQEN